MSQDSWLRSRRTTLVLVGLTLLVLVLSVPGALRDASERDSVYLLSGAFVEDLIKRLTGPGRFRFVLQPLIATFLGIRGGLADAKAGRPPFLYGLSFHREHRRELVKSGVETVANLLMMGILMDSIFQWVILGASHPVAALLVAGADCDTVRARSRNLESHCATAARARNVIGKAPLLSSHS